MSINLSNVAITEFNAMLHQVFQGQGFKMRGTVRTANNVTGDTYKFPKQGKGLAVQKASQDDVSPMNLSYEHATASLENWIASEYSDIFDQAEVNFDEMRALAKAVSMCIGRRMDQIVIDALAASGTANSVAAGGVGFTYAKYLALNAYFSQIGVSRDERRYVVINSAAEQDLLNEDKFINRDFTNNQLLSDGRLDGKEVMGYTWIVIPDNAEGGVTSGKAYAWAENAMGLAIGIDFQTRISYENIKTSWLVNGLFKAGAIAIDNTGIVEINYV